MQNNFNELYYQIKNLKVAYTHASIFHADDLLSAALLKIINPNITIKRINDPIDDNVFMFDIGNGDYDHHDGIKKRMNGTPYASFGLLMRDLYPLFMSEKNYNLFDDCFIREIDLCDNTANINPLSFALKLFNPLWNSKEDKDKVFNNTVNFLIPYLKDLLTFFSQKDYVPKFYKYYFEMTNDIIDNIPRNYPRKFIAKEFCGRVYNPQNLNYFITKQCQTYGKYGTNPLNILLATTTKKRAYTFLSVMINNKIEQINSEPEAYDLCSASYENTNYLLLDKFIPYTGFTNEKEKINFVIFPSERSGYNICCTIMPAEEKIKKNILSKTKVYRYLFPEELRGKSEEELEKKYNGLMFVHHSGFIATCKSKEAALSFVKNL